MSLPTTQPAVSGRAPLLPSVMVEYITEYEHAYPYLQTVIGTKGTVYGFFVRAS
jgi:hypothetical protein